MDTSLHSSGFISVPEALIQGTSFDAQLLVVNAGQEPAPAKDRVFVTQPRQLPHETDQRLAFFPDVPIDPADLVILAIGVVVAVLRAGELVAGEQQRRAPRTNGSWDNGTGL